MNGDKFFRIEFDCSLKNIIKSRSRFTKFYHISDSNAFLQTKNVVIGNDRERLLLGKILALFIVCPSLFMIVDSPSKALSKIFGI